MPPPFLELQHATVLRSGVKALDDVSLSVAVGESVAILGPNGAGKTTLLRLLARELFPVHHPGLVFEIHGQRLWLTEELRRRVGFVSPDLERRLSRRSGPVPTGRELVAAGFLGQGFRPPAHRLPSEEQWERVDSLLDRFGVSELRDRRVLAVSSGELRRLLLARALVHDPEVLVLDEPTVNLDLGAAARLMATVREIHNGGCALFLVTHTVDEVLPGIDRVLLLDRGRVLHEGPAGEVLTSKHLSQLYQTPLEVMESSGYYRVVPG